MLDAEKQEQNSMTDHENPMQENEGGEIKSSISEPKEKTEKINQTNSTVDSGTEVQEYSDEEYQRYVDLYNQTLTDISEGQIVMGRILAITNKEVLVDIGFKSEGTIPLEEFEDPGNIKIGDKVEVFLDSIEDTDGQLILSRKKASFMRLWDKVVDIFNEGGTIEGKCVRRIKGGIVVDLMGVDAFLPGSQIDVKPIRDFDTLIGKTFVFKIVKVNRLRKNIVVSRRALLEESMMEEREKILVELEKGQVREGTVKNITDFGVFVDLGGVDGLLHINDLSWGRINHPSEVVKLDEKIKVVVLDFNDAKDRISLGLKQLQPHPWQEIEKKYPEGAVVKGRVVSIADYGAFIELETGIEGLIHVSEMSWTRHGIHPSKMVSIGEEVEVKVLNVDKERKRISLGLKQLTPDPWDNIEQKYPPGARYKGRVRNMTNFGAFVEMEEGIDGLIHISDLSWTRKIKHPSEMLKKGDEIEVVILEINKKERRVSLGYKQLTEDPWPTFEEAYKVETLTSGKVVRFVDKGLIIELPLGLEGFVPLSQMVEPTMEKVAQSIKEGDELKLVVIEFDRNNKRVVLSRKKAIELEKKDEIEGKKADIDDFIKRKKEVPTRTEIADKSAKREKKKKREKDIKKAKKAEEDAQENLFEQEKEEDSEKRDSDAVRMKKASRKKTSADDSKHEDQNTESADPPHDA